MWVHSASSEKLGGDAAFKSKDDRIMKDKTKEATAAVAPGSLCGVGKPAHSGANWASCVAHAACKAMESVRWLPRRAATAVRSGGTLMRSTLAGRRRCWGTDCRPSSSSA